MLKTPKTTHPSWIEVDLIQFKKNIQILRQHTSPSLLCLPVKANAYGHGLCVMAKAAVEAGVDYLAVAHLQEGILLRKSGIAIPILVLGAIHEDQITDLIHFKLEFTISSNYKADLVAAKCKNAQEKARVHLEIDTGMQRTGVRPASALSLFSHVESLGCFTTVGIYSHFATANTRDDPFTLKQIDLFCNLLKNPVFSHTRLIRHIANSGGVCFYKESYLDMVRPSLLTLGYPPQNAPDIFKNIAPCFSLKSKVSYFKVVEKGCGISYNHTYITKKQTRIVTIPIGYGDGYRRALSNIGSVLIRGMKFPIAGTICMDQLMVDVGENEIHVGDEVVLIGKQGNEEISAQNIAELCNTNIYEVLCFFNDRIPRLYKTEKEQSLLLEEVKQLPPSSISFL